MVYNGPMLEILLALLFFGGLTPRQDVYLLKQIIPDTNTILLLSEKPDTNEDVAQYVIAAPPYNVKIIPLEIPSLRKASETLAGALGKFKPDIIILTDEKTFNDPMLLRLIISQTLPKDIPVMVKSDKQVLMGATFAFDSGDDGKIIIYYNRVSVKKLNIQLPQKEMFVLQEAVEK